MRVLMLLLALAGGCSTIGFDWQRDAALPDQQVDGQAPDVASPDLPGPDAPDAATDLPADRGPDLWLTDAGRQICAAVQPLALVQGKGSAKGQITPGGSSLISQGPTGCTQKVSPGAEQVYAVAMQDGKRYRVRLQPANGFNAALYVFTSCNDPIGTCLVGADQASADQAEEVYLTAGMNGLHYVAVDSSYAPDAPLAAGAFDLTVEEVVLPANNTCSGAKVLALQGGEVTVAGSTASAEPVVALQPPASCTGMTTAGPDLFFRVALAAGKPYRITLETPGHNGALYLFEDCADPAGTCVAGQDLVSSAEQITFTPAVTKSYLVGVDGRLVGDGGPFTLEVKELVPPANDTCGAAQVISPGGSLPGYTLSAASDVSLPQSGCTKSAAAGPDVFYRVQLVGGYTYQIQLLSVDFDPAIYLFQSCADVAGSCVAGSDNAPGAIETLTFTPPISGTYWLGVDGSSPADAGTFQLSITESAKPINDVCPLSNLLTLSAGVAETAGSTAGATDSFSLAATDCTGKTTPGRDLFFSIQLVSNKTYRFVLQPKSFDGALYLFTSCLDIPGTCGPGMGADLYGNIGVEQLTFTPTVGATYRLALDSKNTGSGGEYVLWAAELAPNDTCATALTLGVPAAVQGDTRRGTNQVSLGVTGCTGYSTSGSDLYYSVSLSAGQSRTVTLTPQGFDAALYVFSVCSDPQGSCPQGWGSDKVGAGKAEQLVLTPATSGTYLIAVDSFHPGASGPFTLEVK